MAETPNLEIIQIVAGPIQTNLFLVIEKSSKKTLLIDGPPESLDMAVQTIAERGLSPEMVVLTHGHWDHIADADALRSRYDVPLLIHGEDLHKIEQPSYGDIEGFSPDRLIAEGDQVQLGEILFDVLHTPGHSPGQISLYNAEEAVFLGGDTLFPGGYGTIEIADASAEQTVETIRRLLELPNETVVYPGHGLTTTIGAERHWMERVAESGRLL